MELENVIIFNDPKSPCTGFLSNYSRYGTGFIIDDKRWPTVIHFIQAKKFNGTNYEEKIRQASTVYEAQRMAKGRFVLKMDENTGKMARKRVYGNSGCYYMRDDWDVVKDDLLEEAIRAKFTQSSRLRKRLLDTGDSSLVDQKCELTGPILETIREELRPNTDLDSAKEKTQISLKDLPSSQLSKSNIKVINSLILFSLKISKLEGWDNVHPGMVEDAIYNFAPTQKLKDVLGDYCKTYSRGVSWTIIYNEMPNYRKVITQIQNMLKDETDDEEIKIVTAALIASLIKWLEMEASSKQKKRILQRTSEIKDIDIILPPKKRWYRKNPPHKRVKRRKNKPTDYTESDIPDGLTIGEHGKGFIVYGRTLPKYSSGLLALGGKYPKKGNEVKEKEIIRFSVDGIEDEKLKKLLKMGGKYSRKDENIVMFRGKTKYKKRLLKMGGIIPKTKKTKRDRIYFPYFYREEVDEFISRITSPDQTVKWKKERALDLIDTACHVAGLLNKREIDSKIAKITVRNIWGFPLPASSESSSNDIFDKILTSSEGVKISRSFKFTENAKSIISSSMEISVEDSSEESSEIFNSTQMGILKALHHIMECYSDVVSLNEDVCVRAFITLLPPVGWRKGAKQYMTMILKKYEKWMEKDDVEELLSIHDINFKLDDIKAVLDDEIMFQNKRVYKQCLMVLAVALKYLSCSKKQRYDWLMRRVKRLSSLSKISESVKNDSQTQKGIIEIEGGLTSFESAGWVAVIANSASTKIPSGKPVTDAVFKTYPYSNIYVNRVSDNHYELGSIIQKQPVDKEVVLESNREHRYIACIISEFSRGPPKKIHDTVSKRKEWFESGIKTLFSMKEIKSIAFSLQQLKPDGYRNIIEKYSNNTDKTIYILTGETMAIKPTYKAGL